MSSPVELNDLPVATVANNSDTTLLRQGLTDYQCSVGLIRNINIPSLTAIPNGYANPTDAFMINRTLGGVPQNYKINFSQVGLVQGTQMWFYQGVVPAGWSPIAGTGNRLLAVSDSPLTANPQYYNSQNAGTQTGTWQQTDWTLTPAQLPPHKHQVYLGKSDTNINTSYVQGVVTPNSSGDQPCTAYTSDGSLSFGSPLLGQPHNHGNTWRPLANVGILGLKTS